MIAAGHMEEAMDIGLSPEEMPFGPTFRGSIAGEPVSQNLPQEAAMMDYGFGEFGAGTGVPEQPSYEPFVQPAQPPVLQAGVGVVIPWIIRAAGLAAAWIAARGAPRAIAALSVRAQQILATRAGQVAVAGAAGAAAGYAVSEAGEEEYPTLPAVPAQGRIPTLQVVPGMTPWGMGMPPPEIVAYTWNTGTAIFYRLIDGRIAVQRKNGVWKVYRAQKHIVVPRNPRIATLIRADKRTDRLMNTLARRAGYTTRQKSKRSS